MISLLNVCLFSLDEACRDNAIVFHVIYFSLFCTDIIVPLPSSSQSCCHDYWFSNKVGDGQRDDSLSFYHSYIVRDTVRMIAL